MRASQGKNALNFRGQLTPESSVTTDSLVEFCRSYATRYPVTHIQRVTGLSRKQVENIRQGISGVSGTTLTRWIVNDRDFAGEYAEWVGLIRPGESRLASALSSVFSEYQGRAA